MGIRSAISNAIARFASKPSKISAELSVTDIGSISGVKFTQYNPSDLVGTKGLEEFDKMRLDDQVKGSMMLKKNAVTASGWEVVSPDTAPVDWEVTRFVEHVFKTIKGTLEHDISEILSSLDYGYSITEKVFDFIPSGEFAGLLGLRELKTRKPHSFSLKSDSHGNLTGIMQSQDFKDVLLPVEKFVVLSNNFEFSNWYGTSDLEAAYRAWWSKNNTYKWLTILIERLGVPPIFALYDGGKFTATTIDQLKTALKTLQANSVGVVPHMGKDSLNFWTPQLAKNSTDVFIPAIEMYNKDISRALLMPGQIGMSPDTNVGSFAKAKVHFDVFMMVVEKLRNNDIEERVMNEQIIKQLVDLNFPGITDYPKFRFLPLGDDVTADILDSWIKLVNGGVVSKQPEDEGHIRSALKMPDVTDETILPEKAPAPGLPQSTDPNAPPVDPNQPPAQFALLSRQKDSFEKKVDFAVIDKTLTNMEDLARQRVVEELKITRDKFIKKVDKKFNNNTVFIQNISLNFGTITEVFKELFRNAMVFGREEVQKEIPKKFAVINKSPLFTPSAAIQFLIQKGVTVSGVLKADLEKQVTIILTNAIQQGWTQKEISARITDAFLPFVGDPNVIGDSGALSPHRVENIIRTNTTDAFNNGRLLEMRNNPDFVQAVEYSAILDDRTSPVCNFLDGKKFKLDDPKLSTLTPPNHHNCRSVLVPITIDETVLAKDFIKPSQVGKAEELATKGFV